MPLNLIVFFSAFLMAVNTVKFFVFLSAVLLCVGALIVRDCESVCISIESLFYLLCIGDMPPRLLILRSCLKWDIYDLFHNSIYNECTVHYVRSERMIERERECMCIFAMDL